MPLFSHKILHPEGAIGIWDIRESEDWFCEQLKLHPEEKANLERIRGEGRRREWLGARYLIHKMSGRKDRGALIKDEF